MQYLKSLLMGAAASVLCTGAAGADLGDQIAKLLPNDGAAYDAFGYSVAMSGPTAIVGAYRDDDTGSAYFFDTTTGQQVAKLLAADGSAHDRFGISVGISTTTAIVGAPLDDDNGSGSGSAYLFDVASGQQIGKLLPDDGAVDDYFGISVAISGPPGKEIAVVGAFWDDDNGTDSGSAYVFDAATGQQIAKLLPDDGAAFSRFGGSVGISGTTVVVGAVLHDDFGTSSGAAYLFDTTTGQQIDKLLPNDSTANDYFGVSVAINGATAIVGAHRNDDHGTNSGAAYLFDAATGEGFAKLLPDDGEEGAEFGSSVSISGATAIVGAHRYGPNSLGSAFLFDVSTGDQIAQLVADDAANADRFGWSVGIDGDVAIIAALRDDDNGTNSGSAYLFVAGTGPSPADLFECSMSFGSTDNPPCDVANLIDDDDVDQILRSQIGFIAFERNLVEIVIEGNGEDATSMFSIDTRDGSDTTIVVAKVKARNYVTNSVDDISQYNVSFPSDDTSHSTPVNSADYIDANGDIEVRLRYVAPATFTPLGFTVGLDQVRVMVE